ncbi:MULTISPECIES: DNA glycosylase AlkZ-like family protein [Kitasatospora]|uniref:Alkylhydroperoxidase family enzyme n=2 Tax=Kitasatospora TaxID=2063 RepID=A0ABT1ITD3_9ACTN|nr:crosslink repair DNA glycosylase YcaQ family protein [Kitasatospora paracochleata]MCP2308393.1 alkylhydroperoxidase family enzyme [Kitasatospora paracochleata]
MIEDALLRRWRMHSHFGDDSGAGGPAGVARRVAGLQAQDAAAVRRALRVRGVGDPGEPQRALLAGEVVVTWLMRGTLHLVPAEDARWLVGVFGGRNLAGGARRRRELGLTEDVLAAALEVLPELVERPLSRAELVRELRGRGVEVDPTGQAPAHLTAYAAAQGVLCRGAEVSAGQPGYRPLPPGRALAGEAALGELARWHAGAFGPVGPEDFAVWSGLGPTVARRAFTAAGLIEAAPGLFTLPGAEPPPPGPPLERLLGRYDSFLLGYRDRSLMLDPAHARRINAGGGVIRPAVVRDGRIVGTWQAEGDREAVELWE